MWLEHSFHGGEQKNISRMSYLWPLKFWNLLCMKRGAGER
jgi:hypothetical protein